MTPAADPPGTTPRLRSFDFVVVGDGTGALVTAATLRRHGKSVIRVGAPFPHPDRPVGAGWCPERPPAGFGAAPAPARGLALHGRVMPLPLAGPDVARLMPPARVLAAGVALARARASSAIAAFVGGGREERTYRDWVCYRFGQPVYDAVFAPYARARFGEPEQLLCGVARMTHGERPDGGCSPPAGLYADGGETLDAVVTELRDGGVSTDRGELEGAVVVDLAPQAVVDRWRPGPDPTLVIEAARLHARDGLEVHLQGSLPGGLAEVHFVDAPWFRAVAYPGHVALHLALEPGAPELSEPADALAKRFVQAAASAGVPGLRADGAVVRRLARHHPAWHTSHLTRLRTWTEALVEGGIEPVGRVGLVAPMSPAAIAAYAEDRLVHGASLRDCIRHHVEPAPRDAEARPRLSNFVSR